MLSNNWSLPAQRDPGPAGDKDGSRLAMIKQKVVPAEQRKNTPSITIRAIKSCEINTISRIKVRRVLHLIADINWMGGMHLICCNLVCFHSGINMDNYDI